MSQKPATIYRLIIVVLTVILVFTLFQSPRSTQAAQLAAAGQMLAVDVIGVSCEPFLNFVFPDYQKITDIGTFTVNSADSVVELTFNGRITATVYSDSFGVLFELRVDDLASTIGPARAHINSSGGDVGVPVSFTGLFNGLSAGNHTASMWARSVNGAGSGAKMDPGCWGSDVVIVKEYLPFGVTFLPMITK